ncbi:hypothetical protein HHI36_005359 [Cryptolaemus montrouzieri]|uniref:Uncharacterized protein n=1 Tax=Cryptolaemus montrouzieri TaxID=559131 RepID=A0ABD2NU82_9CUCU
MEEKNEKAKEVAKYQNENINKEINLKIRYDDIEQSLEEVDKQHSFVIYLLFNTENADLEPPEIIWL